jgi:hypothetical protein
LIDLTEVESTLSSTGLPGAEDAPAGAGLSAEEREAEAVGGDDEALMAQRLMARADLGHPPSAVIAMAIAASSGDDWRRARGARLFSRAAVEAGAEALLSERWIAREAALAATTAAASRAGCAQNPARRLGAWLCRARRRA